jgi:HEPN domain-containing protein
MSSRAESRAEAQDWLDRAERDLMAADRMLNHSEPLYDATVFHTQQAVEKALKAFLVAHGREFPKIHDLVPLVVWCQRIDPEFARFAKAARMLTPYATRFRYPGGLLEPEADEAQQAFEIAVDVVKTVRHRLPGDEDAEEDAPLDPPVQGGKPDTGQHASSASFLPPWTA